VEHEVGVGLAPLGEQAVLETGTTDPFEVDGGDDLVGVDVALAQRHGPTGVDVELLHGSCLLTVAGCATGRPGRRGWRACHAPPWRRPPAATPGGYGHPGPDAPRSCGWRWRRCVPRARAGPGSSPGTSSNRPRATRHRPLRRPSPGLPRWPAP